MSTILYIYILYIFESQSLQVYLIAEICPSSHCIVEMITGQDDNNKMKLVNVYTISMKIHAPIMAGVLQTCCFYL